tara:strand:+ start:5764 stop:6009 length:246 start_codon:yes stop_codon:yes gene_type:complete
MEKITLKQLQKIFISTWASIIDLLRVATHGILKGIKLVWNYLWLVPFFIALGIQATAMLSVYLMMSLGAVLFHLKRGNKNI